MCLNGHWFGFPLGLGLVGEDEPSKLSSICTYIYRFGCVSSVVPGMKLT